MTLASADAVPKKRGPKTDVLEALLKRVDGLEAKLKDKKTDHPEATTDGDDSTAASPAAAAADLGERNSKPSPAEAARVQHHLPDTAVFSPDPVR